MKYFILLFLYALSFSADLSGDIKGVLYPDTYYVTDDLIVKEGDRLEIDPGVTLIFNGYFSIKVDGELVVNGVDNYPVVLTSYKDSSYTKEPSLIPTKIDWNRIFVSESGSFTGSNVIFKYSENILFSKSENIKIGDVAALNCQSKIITISGNNWEIVEGRLVLAKVDEVQPDLIDFTKLEIPNNVPEDSVGKSTPKPDSLKESDAQPLNWKVWSAIGGGVAIAASFTAYYYLSDPKENIVKKDPNDVRIEVGR